MSTEFYNRNWRMPNSFNGSEDNNSKFSNYSMSFDGSQYVDTNQSLSSSYSALTLSAWVNYTSLSSLTGTIFGQWIQNNFEVPGSTLICYTVSNKIKVYLGPSASSLTSTTTLSTGTWYNVILRFDGSTMKLYINGTEEDSIAFTAINNSAQNLILGAYSNSGQTGYQSFLNGKLDHVAIFDYALTDGTGGTTNQIAELYGSSSTGVGNPMAITNGRKPISYYPLGDYSAYNGTEYLVPNSAVSDYVFEIIPQGDYINCGKGIGNSIGDNYTGGLTISGWINPNTTTSDDGVFQFGNFTGYEMALVLNASKFIFYNNGQKFAVSYTNPNNEWTNFALTFLPSSSVFYVNGVVAANWTYTDLDLNNLDFIIGSYYNAGFNLTGEVSNFSVFNTALPATGTESIESLYNYGTPPDISSYSGLQGWWKLDASATFDGSNWSIPDSSSNSNTGTSSGMTAANLVQSNLNILSPYSRYALDFDGTSDYIETSLIDITGNKTVSLWIKPTVTGNNGAILTIGQAGASSDNLSIGLWESNIQALMVQNTYKRRSTTTIAANTWYNIVIVKSTNTIENIYINSFNSTLNNTGGWNATIDPSQSSIGKASFNSGSNFQYFNGSISNISVWNAALSSAQVTEIYSNGLPSNLKNHSAYSNLVSWWQLGENMSYDSNVWTVIDEKGTNNGTGANLAPAEDSIVNGVGTSGNGLSDGMGAADNIIGEAPYSTSNALSYGMGADAKSTSVPS